MKYIISILFLLAYTPCVAQGENQAEVDTVDVAAKKKAKNKPTRERVVKDFKPSAFNVGLEAIGLARTGTSTGFTQFEGQADIDFDRYFFVIDLGHESNSISNNEFSYSNRGNYMRAGFQINMMPFNPNRNFFFFGLRYARSGFSDEIVYNSSFDKWGEKKFSYKNNNVSARWWEFNMGMKVKVFERLYFGYTIRYKLNKKITGFGELIPRNIPGFGLADKSSNAGFNYYFLYHIPFRDKPVPKKPKRVPRERTGDPEPTRSSNSFQRSF